MLARSAGVYHWTPEGRKLFDFSSGVLVANLGHNPSTWMKKFTGYMGWSETDWQRPGYFSASPMTAYNAITPVETQASKRLANILRKNLHHRLLACVWTQRSWDLDLRHM